jgi:hypothetical protein
VSDLESVYTRSDHYSYAAKGVPIIFFTTGLHRDYHFRTDEVDRIEFAKMARIAELVYTTATRVANLDHAPARDFAGPRMGQGRTGVFGRTRNPKSQIPNPKSQIPNPKSQIPSPKTGRANGIPIAGPRALRAGNRLPTRNPHADRPATRRHPTTAHSCAAGAPVAARSGVPSRLTKRDARRPVTGAHDGAEIVALQHYEDAVSFLAGRDVSPTGCSRCRPSR